MNVLITTSLILLSPILLIQGWLTRRTTPVLPEAGPPFAGLVGAGGGGPLHLIVLGDLTQRRSAAEGRREKRKSL
jgi:hypothetical protein